MRVQRLMTLSITRRRMLWAVVGQATPLLTTVVLTPFLISHLGLARYGVWTLVMSLAVMLTSIDGGVSASLLRWFSVHRGRGDHSAFGRLFTTVALAQLVLVIVLGLVLFAVAPVLVGAFNIPNSLDKEATQLFRSIGPILLLMSFGGLCGAALQAMDRFRATALVAAVTQGTYMVLVLTLVSNGSGLLRLIVALLVGQGLGACVAFVVVVGQLPRSRKLMSRKEIGSFWSYSWRMQVTGVTALVNLEADALVVALLLPVRYVAFYSLGATAATYIRNLPLWLLPPVATRLFRAMGQRGVSGAVDEFRTLHARWMGVIVGYSLVALVSGGVGLVAWLGTRFWPAAVVCAVLTAGNAVNLMTAVMSNFARAIGRPGLEARYGGIVMAVNIALTVPAGLFFGMYGVVAATAIGQVVGSATFLTMLRSSVSASLGRLFAGLDLRQVLLALLVAAAAQSVVLMTLRGAGLAGLLAAVLGGALGLGVLVMTADRRQLRTFTTSAG